MSARPIGLGLRQTPDARVIQLTPHAPRPGAAGVGGAAALAFALWAVARAQLDGAGAVGASGLLLLAWAALGLAWWMGRRRARERLELYVGRRELVVVRSLDGNERHRATWPLADVLEPRAHPRGVHVPMTTGRTWWLPMAGEEAEARAWMVEHLREAGRDARKRA